MRSNDFTLLSIFQINIDGMNGIVKVVDETDKSSASESNVANNENVNDREDESNITSNDMEAKAQNVKASSESVCKSGVDSMKCIVDESVSIFSLFYLYLRWAPKSQMVQKNQTPWSHHLDCRHKISQSNEIQTSFDKQKIQPFVGEFV